MDDSWQSKWQSATLPPPPATAAAAAAVVAPSCQFQPSDSRNQMMNASHNFYPHVVEEPSSSARKMRSESMFQFTSNSTLYNSGHVLQSPSFSLFSEAPSMVQCDQQQLPYSKPFPSSKVSVSSSSLVVGPTGHGISLMSPEPLLQSPNNCYQKYEVNIYPVISSGIVASAGGNNASRYDVLQSAEVNDSGLELGKAVNHHSSYGNKKVNGFSSLREGSTPCPSPAQKGKLNSTSTQALQKLLGSCPSVPHQSSLTNGYRRVFCLYASGDLLLSNTGFLGVVCSCHGLHMSVSNFSEHSGLRDINPGDAVHMDSGETIAHWRKDYFNKLGIRIPEDRSGWDWPEGFSAALDLLKSCSRATNMSRSTDMSNSIGTSGALFAPGQTSSNVACLHDPNTNQKLVNKVLHNEVQGNAEENAKFLSPFIGTSQSNVHSLVVNKILELPASRCLSMPKSVEREANDFRSNSTYIDPIPKTKSSFISSEALQNLIAHGKDSDFTSGCLSMSKLVGGAGNDYRSNSNYIAPASKTNNSFISPINLQNLRTPQMNSDASSGCLSMPKIVRGVGNDLCSNSTYIDPVPGTKTSFILVPDLQNLRTPMSNLKNPRDSDSVQKAAVSSNFELRLGQPSQQNCTLGNSNETGFNTHPVSRPEHHQEFLPMKPQVYNRGSTRVIEECKQYLSHEVDVAQSCKMGKNNHLEFVNHAPGVSRARNAVQTDKSKGVSARVSVTSTLFPNSESSRGKIQAEGHHHMANSTHVMPQRRTCESDDIKCDLINFSCYRDNTTKSQFNITDLRNCKHMDKDKELGHTAVSESLAQEVNLGCHMKFMGGLISSGFDKIICDPCSLVCEKSSHLCRPPDVSADASASGVLFNCPYKASSFGQGGHRDHSCQRSVTSSLVDSGIALPSRGLSTGVFSVLQNTSPNTSNIPSELSTDKSSGVNPYLLDGSFPIPSHEQAGKYFNQNRLTIPPRTTEDVQTTAISSFNNEVRSALAFQSKLIKRRDEQGPESRDEHLELPRKSLNSCITFWADGVSEKSDVIRAVSKQTSLQLGDNGMQHNPLSSSLPTEEPILRSLCEHGACCQSTTSASIPDKFRCSLQESCLGGSSNLRGKTSLGAFGEHTQSGSDRISMLPISVLNKHGTFLKDNATSSDETRGLMQPNLKKDECNAFQWKDVPSKPTRMCTLTCKDQPSKLPDSREIVDLVSDVPPKIFNDSAEKAECMKEQVQSNISSKCSAPAVTQASVKMSNGDSCVDDAHNTDFAKHIVVDEGSAIEKSSSSYEALESRTQVDSSACEFNSTNEVSSKTLPDQPFRSLIDELRLRDSLRLKKMQNQNNIGLTIHEDTSSRQHSAEDLEAGKRKKSTEWKSLDVPFPASVSSLNDENQKFTGSSEGPPNNMKDLQQPVQPSQETPQNCSCPAGPSFKRKRSTVSPSIPASPAKDVHRLDINGDGETSWQRLKRAYDDGDGSPISSCGKRSKLDRDIPKSQQVCKQNAKSAGAEISVKFNSLNDRIKSSQQGNISESIVRPIVCGKYGIISNGNASKPVMILSIKKIYRTTRRCNPAHNSPLKLSRAGALDNPIKEKIIQHSGKFSFFNTERVKGGQGASVPNTSSTFNVMEETETACFPGCNEDDHALCILEKGRRGRGRIPDSTPSTRIKRKIKEVRKRSLNELISRGMDSSSTFPDTNHRGYVPEMDCRYLKKFKKSVEDNNDIDDVDISDKSTEKLSKKSTPDVDAFCCVCGSSKNDEFNRLLNCNRCLIRVHQACYGVSRVPKIHWYCRPCKISSKNIACVLCGYKGGLMTRALRSSDVVKSLLSASFVREGEQENSIIPSQAFEDRLNVKALSRSQIDVDAPSGSGLAYVESSSVTVQKKDLQANSVYAKKASCPKSGTVILDSIRAGVLDANVMQWVHMICGLWTPGTRCPNVYTMSSFDVSGASCSNPNVVCSICSRPGGCCIRCRVRDCHTRFHPWCAHQKGLLQSEVEGDDNDKVGFYGRCELHAAESNFCDIKLNSSGEKESTCARTEGFKGRKWEGYRHNIHSLSNGTNGGSLVPQEQLDAWLHINRQKSSRKGFQKLPFGPIQDNNYDYRKEYYRYKQLKSWKHMVVYKSGIHGLGLYTSCFISRGAMVVEYVGEIVGLRVADRRELEYQSGKKLQYKSACYFFRIDKEHIIDATHKGGVARFVNHSCLPNCVAKVITLRSEKKVVFFAERDIYPGEEITYDYHFNHEDEGKKIPCFCNAKNCRRYLN